MEKIWKEWTNLTKKIAYYIANVLLACVYVVLIVPLALILQTFFNKALFGHKYMQKNNSFWIKRQKSKQDLRFAKEQ